MALTESMLETFRPLLEAAAGVDLDRPEDARLTLLARLDPRGDVARRVNAELLALLEEGRIAERGEPPVRWGRVAKASSETLGFSIDAVWMSGPGPRHRHPDGEVNWCVALEGNPSFEGQPAGWVVLPAGSTHVPRVEAGTMLIVYLLPGGKIEFL